MKKVKLNSFERFVIKYRLYLLCAIFSIYFLICYFTADSYNFALSIAEMVICSVVAYYVSALAILKSSRVALLQRKNFDVSNALNVTNELISLTNKKYRYFSYFINNRICYYIQLGEYQLAQNELAYFFAQNGNKEIPKAVLLTMYINSASIKMAYGDKNGFDAQLQTIKSTFKRVNNKKFKSIIKTLELEREAVFGEYSDKLEQELLTMLEQRRPDNQPLTKVDIYFHLFIYFKRFNQTQKAVYYAQQILNMNCEQLYFYKYAKEYLENANTNN